MVCFNLYITSQASKWASLTLLWEMVEKIVVHECRKNPIAPYGGISDMWYRKALFVFEKKGIIKEKECER